LRGAEKIKQLLETIMATFCAGTTRLRAPLRGARHARRTSVVSRSGSSYGTCFRLMTWGESHGRSVGVVIDGVPPRLPVDEEQIQYELDRYYANELPSRELLTPQNLFS